MWRVEWHSWKAHSFPEVLTTMSDVGKVPEWNYWNNQHFFRPNGSCTFFLSLLLMYFHALNAYLKTEKEVKRNIA